MRRSLAPSQVKQRRSSGGSDRGPSSSSSSNQSSEVTIQRLPLFGFLSIPNDLKKQFKIPSGCVISKENIALRKTKTLGLRRSLPLVVPGGYVAPIPRPVALDAEVTADETSSTVQYPPHERLILWRDPEDDTKVIEVVPKLASCLRPHQREGVEFLFECTMGLRGFDGEGCILADDMGLGKTLMSITLLWTLLNQGMEKEKSAVQKAIVVCPTSLVGNWENELRKWVGDHCPTFAVKNDPKKMIRNFIGHRSKGILIISYETQRRYCEMFTANNGKGTGGFSCCCELLICDEAHKLKNADSGLSKSLNLLPAKKRILLSGTPMQNELTEFFNMVNFCNPGVLGTVSSFRKQYEHPILRAREPDASSRDVERAEVLQKELSTIVNEFILKRGNILNARHLPPKLVQFLCCKLTPLQERLYECVLNSKESRHLRDGKQTKTLNSLRHMLSICSHPDLIISSYRQKKSSKDDIVEDEVLEELYKLMMEHKKKNINEKGSIKEDPKKSSNGRADRAAMRKIKKSNGFSSSASSRSGFDPELSGKFLVLFRLMSTLRNTSQERIVIVSNTTQTLDLVESMCNDNNWPLLRLDGSTTAQKRTKQVDTFNDPSSNSFAFLLSSKAGGCGINLIGGSRLVMMDPDWNPASDKQAAARIWREGQKKRCYIYRLMSTCTIEEKIIQRQLSKEGLQSIVDNSDQVNSFSSSELKSLFQRDNVGTRSNTHDTLRCKRCKCVSNIDSTLQNSIKFALLQGHVDICKKYLAEMLQNVNDIIQVNAAANEIDEVGQRPSSYYSKELARIIDELNGFDETTANQKTLPDLSKEIRAAILAADKDLKDDFGVHNITLFNDFVASWTSLVPSLQEISKRHVKMQMRKPNEHNLAEKENISNSKDSPCLGKEKDNDDGDDDDEYVEQEGCPDEEDFNRWSHHSSVRSCYGDEMLQTAMSMGDNDEHGDNTISFIFGLEVNWDLLQQKIAESADREEKRRLQAKADLEELNRKRKASKLSSEGKVNPDSGNGVARCLGNSYVDDSDSSSSEDDSSVEAASPQSVQRDNRKSRRRKLEMDCDESCSESEVDSPENIQLSRTKQNPHKKEKNSGENGIGSDESDCDSCDEISTGCSENDDSRIVSECPGSGGSNIDQCESDGDEGSRGVSDDSIEESKNADLDFERSSRWHCLSCTYLNSYPSRLCEMCGYALCLSIIIQPSQCSVAGGKITRTILQLCLGPTHESNHRKGDWHCHEERESFGSNVRID